MKLYPILTSMICLKAIISDLKKSAKGYQILFNQIKNIFVLELIDDDFSIITKFDGGNFNSRLVETSRCNINFDYKLKLRKHIWYQFVNQIISYDEISFSRRFRIVQKPNGFSYSLIRLFKSLHSNRLLIEYQKNLQNQSLGDICEIDFGDKKYNIKKYCPHLFASLENEIPNNDGIITCPAHGWMFDIRSGKCINGDSNTSIKV